MSKSMGATLDLSPLDHLMPRRYAIKLLYFPVSSPDVTQITSALTSSLDHMFKALPILSGTVKLAPHSLQKGKLCVGSPWNEIGAVFRVNDLTSSDLDYDDLRRHHFPMTALQEHDMFSVLTSRTNPLRVENPVMMAQINFVRNGVVLVQFLHHSFMDGLGGVVVMGMWATFCKGENGMEKFRAEMMDRERLMVSSDTGCLEDFQEYVSVPKALQSGKAVRGEGEGSGFLSRGYGLANYILDLLGRSFKTNLQGTLPYATISRSSNPTPQLLKEVETEIFFFSRSKLIGLKSEMSACLATSAPKSSDSRTPSYVSTNDCLSAFLFACITEARKFSRSTDPHTLIPFGLTVSGRRLLDPPLPDKYVGNMSLFAHLDLPLHSVTADVGHMAQIAHAIRKRLSQLNEGYVTKLIGALHAVDDLSKVAPACRASMDWPFMITPWTGQAYYSMDWGSQIGVKCERLRVPKVSWPAFDGVIIILPELKVENGIKDGETGLEVMVGLEKGTMQRLKSMTAWTTQVQWRCS